MKISSDAQRSGVFVIVFRMMLHTAGVALWLVLMRAQLAFGGGVCVCVCLRGVRLLDVVLSKRWLFGWR